MKALVRWRHPRLGIVPPNDFILVAEDCGLIIKIGRQVLLQFCRQLVEWTRLTPGRRLAVTVNISPRQIAEPGFFEELRQILADTDIDPTAMCPEITENALMGAREMIAAPFPLYADRYYGCN